MPTLASHSAQEISALYGQLSHEQQNALFSYLEKLLAQNQPRNDDDSATQSLLALAGSLKTNIRLSDEELEEAIRLRRLECSAMRL